MKRSARFEKIVDINRNYENIAGMSFSAAQSEYQQELDQLNQLKIYREEYKERYKTRLTQQIQPEEIRDFQFFFKSLEQAIGFQEKRVSKSCEVMNNSQLDWMDKKNEVKKITELANRAKGHENEDLKRQERNELDELTQNLFNFHQNHKQ